jgi:hypothetical protein
MTFTIATLNNIAESRGRFGTAAAVTQLAAMRGSFFAQGAAGAPECASIAFLAAWAGHQR